jgi:hypothetical protein
METRASTTPVRLGCPQVEVMLPQTNHGTTFNGEGRRETIGLDIGAAEDGATWTAFLHGLVARGLSGVKLVVSDAHHGLKPAIAAVLEGASWQRSSVNTGSVSMFGGG